MRKLIGKFIVYFILMFGCAAFGFAVHDIVYTIKTDAANQKELQREIEEDHSQLLPEKVDTSDHKFDYKPTLK